MNRHNNIATHATVACRAVTVAWQDEEWDALFVSTQQRALVRTRRRRRLRQGAGALALLLLMAGGALTWRSRLAPEVSQPLAVSSSEDHLLRFSDGSTVTMLAPGTVVSPISVNDEQTHLQLVKGAARFVVTPRALPHFRVQAHAVDVEVLGTVFELEREGDLTHVRVEEGLVLVRWPGGAAEVASGQAGWFPPVAPAAAPAEVPARAPATNAQPRSQADWRRLAHKQEFSAAWDVLERERQQVKDEPGDLLLAADAARLGGRPTKAVPYLHRVVKRHPRDARAPAAAFTLGRLYLDTLASPRKAAEAFAEAYRLAPQGPLAEDAAYRQVEALVRSDDLTAATNMLKVYARKHPDGARLQRLEKLLRARRPSP